MPTDAVVRVGFATKFKIKVLPQLNFTILGVRYGNDECLVNSDSPLNVVNNNSEITIFGNVEGNIDNMPTRYNCSVLWHTEKTETWWGRSKTVNNYRYVNVTMSISEKEGGVYSFTAKPKLNFKNLCGGLYGNARIKFQLVSGIPYATEQQVPETRNLLSVSNRIIDIEKPSNAVIRRGSKITFKWNKQHPMLNDIDKVWIDIYRKWAWVKRVHLTLNEVESVDWLVGDGYSVNYGLGADDFYYILKFPYAKDRKGNDLTFQLERNENFVDGLGRPVLTSFRLKHYVDEVYLHALELEKKRAPSNHYEGLEKQQRIDSFKRRAFGDKMYIEGVLSGYADGALITPSELRLYRGSDPEKMERFHVFEGVSFTLNNNSFRLELALPEDKAEQFFQERVGEYEGGETIRYLVTLRLASGSFTALVDIGRGIKTGSHVPVRGGWSKHLVRYNDDSGVRACSTLMPPVTTTVPHNIFE